MIFYYNLYHFDLIFLQHGISKDDVSNLLHRFFKNFSMIITASKYEYKSFLSPNYGYENKNIKLTGFQDLIIYILMKKLIIQLIKFY
jgi:hypothetical protein